MLEQPLVRTIEQKCKVCYTCVRECPAKAIRIVQGQATVVPERCIGCGNCVRVCRQNAKEVLSCIEKVWNLLVPAESVAAVLAPSFPAEFDDCDYRQLIGMIRALGFDMVNEVAFGADLVAQEYRRLLDQYPKHQYIATTCPAIVSYVEYYHPSLLESLAPVVSPMVATARALRHIHGENLRIVFIGPCIAKKGEAETQDLPDTIDAVLTFAELRKMFAQKELRPGMVEPSDFDEPRAGKGRLFPIARGLLEAAKIDEDLIVGDVVASDGRENFLEAIREFESGALHARLLEVLCCRGCIMGAGMTRKNVSLFQRRSLVSAYARRRLGTMCKEEEKEEEKEYEKARFDGLDLSRCFSAKDQRIPLPSNDRIREILVKMGKVMPEDELDCGACGYETCREHAVAILKGLAESEMCLPYTIDQLKKTVQQLADSNEEVVSIQNALMQSEKLAHMGQLAAGVAHEVNNPLGIVLMYAHLLLEKYEHDRELKEDLNMIVEQADRCKRIVSGLLDFARENKTIREPTNIVSLINDSVKSVKLPQNIEVEVKTERLLDPVAEIDRDQITQVLVNLYANAQAAMPQGGHLVIEAFDTEENVSVSVSDEGTGIPEEHLSKIFDPFFTTKQIGNGTGLGLAVLYGIVKMHRGKVTVQSNADESKGSRGTTFIIKLPRKDL